MISIRTSSRAGSNSSSPSNEAGTTIIQVTHSETNASYSSRVIHLRDGWIVDE